MRPWLHVILLCVVGAVAFFPSLGQESMVEDTESRHSDIARTMMVTGNYLVPYYRGHPYIDKPPLFNWAIVAAYKATCRIDFAASRIPSALCATAAAICIYLLGRRWLSARAGVFAALIWSTSWLVVEWGRCARPDMVFTCLILYAILLADRSLTQTGTLSRFANAAGSALLIAAATMSKNPLALVFFISAVVLICRARTGRWRPNFALICAGVAVSVAFLAVWMLLAETSHPGHAQMLLDRQFRQGPTQHPNRFYLYFDQLPLRTAPWCIFAIGGAFWIYRRVRRTGYDQASIPAFFTLIWIIILTLTPTKREHYLLPILPMWSLFIGGFLDHALNLREVSSTEQSEKIPGWQFIIPVTAILAAAFLFSVVGDVIWLFTNRQYQISGGILCSVAVVIAAFGFYASLVQQEKKALKALFCVLLLAVAGAYPLIYKAFVPPDKTLVELRRVASEIQPGLPVGDFDTRYDYLLFKLNRPVTFLEKPEEVLQFVEEPGARYLMLPKKSYDSISSQILRKYDEVEDGTIGKRNLVLLKFN